MKFYIPDFLNEGDVYIFVTKILLYAKNCLTSLINI
jgi:hypothetical protein